MKKHYSPLAVIETCDTTHLSEKGAEQVQGFIDYLKPRYQAIIDGQIKKEEVVRYYLEQEESYTDAAKKLIGNLSQALGISKGYISKIKSTDKYLDGLHNHSFKEWVNEHPVGCRYYIGKIDHQTSMNKFLTGEHFSQRELEGIVSAETKINTASPETKTDFQLALERDTAMVESDEYPLIRSEAGARCYRSGTRKGRIEACAQSLYEMKWLPDEETLKMLNGLKMIIKKVEQLQKYESAKGLK